jgi:hypothetical protein
MSFNTPILFLTYKRFHTSIRVFNSIKKIKPNKLYFASNAPQNDREKAAVQKVRDIIKKINWRCKLVTIFYSKHMPVKESIPTSINFFFKKEKQGIILEDDILPSKNFYFFCQKMLKIYKNNKKINCISGNRFLKRKKNSLNIYFSKYHNIWGWATWRTRWKNYDPHIKFWPKFQKTKKFKNLNENIYEFAYWKNIFDKTYKGKINTWDYQLQACAWYNNQLCIIPPVSLTQNIGFGRDAEHTIARNKFIKKRKENKINFTFPKKITQDVKNDWYNFKYFYRSASLTKKERVKYHINRFLNDPILFLILLKKNIKSFI